MMKFRYLIFLLLTTPMPAHADTSGKWSGPANDLQSLAGKTLDNSGIVSDFVAMINTNFKSTDALPVNELRINIDTSDYPSVDLDSHEINLPYTYLIQAISAQAELEETRQSALTRGMDMTEYTLYHLWGHLLAEDLSPDSDDMAEAISSWLMIKSWPNGGEQWFTDSEAFGRASQLLDGSLNEYWHTHSLHKSRNTTINCWILGSDPDRYESLLKITLDPQARRKQCISEWKILDNQMTTLLSPLLKENAPVLK